MEISGVGRLWARCAKQLPIAGEIGACGKSMKLVVPVEAGFESNSSPVLFWSRGCVTAIAGRLPKQVFSNAQPEAAKSSASDGPKAASSERKPVVLTTLARRKGKRPRTKRSLSLT